MSRKSYIEPDFCNVTLPQLPSQILKYEGVINIYTMYTVTCIVSYLTKHMKDYRLEFWTDYECQDLLERIKNCHNIVIYYSSSFNVPCLKIDDIRLKFITNIYLANINVVQTEVQYLEYRKFCCINLMCINKLVQYFSNFPGKIIVVGMTYLFENVEKIRDYNGEQCDILISFKKLPFNLYKDNCKRAFFITCIPDFEMFEIV